MIQVLLPDFQQAIALHNHGYAGVAEYAVEIAFRGVIQAGLLQFPQQFGGVVVRRGVGGVMDARAIAVGVNAAAGPQDLHRAVESGKPAAGDVPG